MAKRRMLVTTCDWCQKESADIKSRTLVVNKRQATFDACGECSSHSLAEWEELLFPDKKRTTRTVRRVVSVDEVEALAKKPARKPRKKIS